MKSIGRRRFLLNAGLMAVAAPFVRTLTSHAAQIPSRMVLLFHGNGHRMGQWALRRTDTDFDLLRIAKPLEPFKSQSIFFQGLNHGAMARCRLKTTKHGLGSGIAWTGTGVLETGWPTGASVDQVVAARIGDQTPIRSLQLGSACHDTNVYGRVSFGEGGRPLAPVQEPAKAYAQLFAPLLAGDDQSTAAKRLLARNKSVLDFVRRDVCALSSELSGSDRLRLEAHCEGLREAERSLAAGLDAGDAAVCKPVDGLVADKFSPANYQQTIKDHVTLTRLALACGLTRVVSLQLGQAHGWVVPSHLGIKGGHHDLSHHRGSGKGEEPYIKISVWYAEMVAHLLSSLQAVDEGGSTLLDHTVLAWGSDIADGENHSENNMPWAVFGGRNLGIVGGRMLDAKQRNANDLLISLCHAMGLSDVKTFGHADLCAGPLLG